MTRRRLHAVLMAAGLLVVSACGGDDGATATPSVPVGGSPTPTVSGVPAGEARIEITSPEEGATVAAKDVVVTVEVSGFDLVDKIGKKAAEGEGHIVYYLGSGYEIPVNPDYEAHIGGTGGFTSYFSSETSYKWPNANPGRQTLTVQLVNNDKTPLVPAQSDQVTITVS